MEDRTKPTSAQLKYCRFLMRDLGYDETELYEHGIEAMTRKQISRLIEELEYELGE